MTRKSNTCKQTGELQTQVQCGDRQKTECAQQSAMCVWDVEFSLYVTNVPSAFNVWAPKPCMVECASDFQRRGANLRLPRMNVRITSGRCTLATMVRLSRDSAIHKPSLDKSESVTISEWSIGRCKGHSCEESTSRAVRVALPMCSFANYTT